MAKRVRLERFKVEEAEEFFMGNRVNLYGQEIFIELYAKRGEGFPNVWFEDLRAEMIRGTDNRPSTELSGRYCVKKTSEGKRERCEIEFRSLESGKVEVIRQGDYKLRYRRVRD